MMINNFYYSLRTTNSSTCTCFKRLWLILSCTFLQELNLGWLVIESKTLTPTDCRGTQVPKASSEEKLLPSGVTLDKIILTTLKNEPLFTLCILKWSSLFQCGRLYKKRLKPIVASAYPLAHNYPLVN